jgi:hypothetical protein
VYTLMSLQEQQHYFKEFPERISDQLIKITTQTVNNKNRLNAELDLAAIRIKDPPSSLEIIRNNQFPYQAIVLIFDAANGTTSSQLNVLDFGVDSNVSLLPNLEYYGAYQIGNNEIAESTNRGMSLILPDIISNTNEVTFYQVGRDRVNTIFKSSIRPYERRIARRFGFYDLRFDYDIGRKLLAQKTEGQTQDLLGVNLISNVYNEKAFLSIRSDVDLSSDNIIAQEQGIKITQVELTYYFQPNFSFAFKNINEYAEKITFDPRFSINYGYAF